MDTFNWTTPSINELPDWASDISQVSAEMRNAWLAETAARTRYNKYFTGKVFEEKVNSNDPENDTLLYPVGMNLAKMICITLADSMFGEWTEDIVTFEPNQDLEDINTDDKKASKLLQNIIRYSNINSKLWEIELERNIYGGGVLQVSPSFTTPGHVIWSRVDTGSFFPIWSPDDQDDLLEVYVVIPMTRDQARLKWHIETDKDVIYRIEHWTKDIYENHINGIRVEAYSGVNPWRVVPFVYIPRFRVHKWWGESAIDDVIATQDELNMRLADVGEAVNYNTHPVRWGVNLPKSFKPENFPVGPNVFWDLGRVIGDSPKPELGILEAKNPTPQGTFDYIEFLYNWSRVSAFTPAVSLGDDDGGGQRSGITLEIRMAPLIRSIRRSRSYLSTGLMKAARITAAILEQKEFSDTPKRALQSIIDGRLVPKFANILPRDQAALVDEVTKRFSTTPPSISLETAVNKLGDGTNEVNRIVAMVGNDKLYRKVEPVSDAGNPPGLDGKNGPTINQKTDEGEK